MRKISFTLGLMLLISFQAFGQDVSNYLITTNIGDFTASKNPSYGKGPGLVVGANHFYIDHTDMTYEIDYFNLQTKVGPEVQVTQHTGSDSDKWLLHEIERGYRRSKQLHTDYLTPNILRQIDSNKIFNTWGYYSWISNNVVVNIEFTDLTGTKPEPIEVVRAYLQKFPSTVPPSLVFDKDHTKTWIKDEMERRLWLCDKWFTQLALGKAQQTEVLQESVKSMNVFLDYREKYFGSLLNPLKAGPEKNILAGYLNQNNITAIKDKLAEYKKWWNDNKGKAINVS